MRSRITALLTAATALGGILVAALPPAFADGAAQAEAAAAIAKADTELAAAEKVGHVWRLIDSATGGSAVGIDQLLKVAKEKQAAGEFDEARRLADRVAEAAMLGQEQAKLAADAGPKFPAN